MLARYLAVRFSLDALVPVVSLVVAIPYDYLRGHWEMAQIIIDHVFVVKQNPNLPDHVITSRLEFASSSLQLALASCYNFCSFHFCTRSHV